MISYDICSVFQKNNAPKVRKRGDLITLKQNKMETEVRISGEVMSRSAIRNKMIGYTTMKVINGDIILVFCTKKNAKANIMKAWASLSEEYGDDITTVSDSGDCMSFDAAQAKII